MVKPIGKFLRVLRIKNNESAKDMAEKLDISPSYLAAIELGKRSLPEDIEKRVINQYTLSNSEKDEFFDIVNEHQGYIRLNTSELGEKKKKILMTMLNCDIDETTIEKLCGIIENKGDENNEK